MGCIEEKNERVTMNHDKLFQEQLKVVEDTGPGVSIETPLDGDDRLIQPGWGGEAGCIVHYWEDPIPPGRNNPVAVCNTGALKHSIMNAGFVAPDRRCPRCVELTNVVICPYTDHPCPDDLCSSGHCEEDYLDSKRCE